MSVSESLRNKHNCSVPKLQFHSPTDELDDERGEALSEDLDDEIEGELWDELDDELDGELDVNHTDVNKMCDLRYVWLCTVWVIITYFYNISSVVFIRKNS